MHAFLSKNDQQGHESEPYQITYLGKYQTLTLANHSLPLTEHMVTKTGFGITQYAESYCQRIAVFAYVGLHTKSNTRSCGRRELGC